MSFLSDPWDEEDEAAFEAEYGSDLPEVDCPTDDLGGDTQADDDAEDRMMRDIFSDAYTEEGYFEA